MFLPIFVSPLLNPKPKKEGAPMPIIWMWSILGTLVTTLAFGGWHMRSYVEDSLVHKSEFIVVQAQAQTALDQQMELLIAQIERLQSKASKSQDDREQIKYLREQLDRLRKIRSIK